jgi:hypothetical protein
MSGRGTLQSRRGGARIVQAHEQKRHERNNNGDRNLQPDGVPFSSPYGEGCRPCGFAPRPSMVEALPQYSS